MRHETRCMQASRAEKPLPARTIQLGRLLRATIVALGFALAAPMTAGAHDTLNNALSDNVYRGYVGAHGPNRVVPWVRTFYIQQLQCVKFQIDSQHTDLEMVVVSTNPSRRYRNNSGALPNPCGATCPIVRIPETGFASGYYTVHVSPANGGAIPGEFLLRVSVAAANDAMCSPATPAF